MTQTQNTGLCYDTGEPVLIGDAVSFYGQTYTVVFEAGAFGLGCKETIDWDTLQNAIPSAWNGDFCMCDNFISFWEIIWNWNASEPTQLLPEVKLIKRGRV